MRLKDLCYYTDKRNKKKKRDSYPVSNQTSIVGSTGNLSAFEQEPCQYDPVNG